jgi:hypothetical protein
VISYSKQLVNTLPFVDFAPTATEVCPEQMEDTLESVANYDQTERALTVTFEEPIKPDVMQIVPQDEGFDDVSVTIKYKTSADSPEEDYSPQSNGKPRVSWKTTITMKCRDNKTNIFTKHLFIAQLLVQCTCNSLLLLTIVEQLLKQIFSLTPHLLLDNYASPCQHRRRNSVVCDTFT